MRFFNTTGPVRLDDHYHVPPLDRLALDEVLTLIQQKKYFVLHAPRQTGKTSSLLALRDLLNAEGDYRCVYVNVEAAQALREDVEQAMRTLLGGLASRARLAGDEFLDAVWLDLWTKYGAGALGEALTRWAEASPKPLVLLIDEIDALVGDTLVSVLRQLRAGYDLRPESFPQSLVLCGVRDVRDYRIQSTAENAMIAGGSAFNIKAESLRLGDFSAEEVQDLLAQHTAETGQVFTDDALETIWKQTQGQPWLVNALAYETCFKSEVGRNRSHPVVAEALLVAQEQLIRRRETHLDQLADKLKEERVRRVVEPLLSGGEQRHFADRDLEYVRDLGLLAQDRPLRMANPIYAEVVPRELTWVVQEEFEQDTAWYVDAEGGLDVDKLMSAFQAFFREHSEHWVGRFQYQEAGPQLLLQAFLQRIVNSGGRIEREYGLGRGRTDLLIVWPQGEQTRKVVVECKILHKSLEQTVAEGVEQTVGYMDRCGAEAGHLVIFDRRENRRWADKVFYDRRTSVGGTAIEVWGM
ncbi:MAG: AAA-like domain-containing protein [Gemmatimonadota bacterium]|nr:AAA-like domain-containing protein [Gemmatimonadota bacterium]